MTSKEPSKQIRVDAPAMSKNDRIAAENQQFFDARGLLAVNLISSPGSGKTALLEALAERLGPALAVIAGDVQTDRDAARIRKTGCAVQAIETGGACHLDAKRVQEALAHLPLEEGTHEILVIENVGNLVCPSSFLLGEHMKMAILSVPEGDDKVLKYPSIFSRIGCLVLNKIDLLAAMDFDPDRVEAECRSLNEGVRSFRLSAKTGQGVDALCTFLQEKRSSLQASSRA